MKKNILIFSYDGPHKKSEDLFYISQKKNLNIKMVVLNPWEYLKKKNNFKGFKSIIDKPSITISKVLNKLGYNYIICQHSQKEKIKQIIKKNKINLGIIFGARILKKDIIDLFEDGIINYHPGSLPQTSGLDSLYWMIRKKTKPTVTAHFIDGKVDAGFKIFEKKISTNNLDTISNLEKKLYLGQLELHKKICNFIINNKSFKIKKIKNYSKNFPMTVVQKKLSLKTFNDWKKI